MPKKRFQIKDSQVKKNLKWHILRLLRLNSRTRQELIEIKLGTCMWVTGR